MIGIRIFWLEGSVKGLDPGIGWPVG